MGARVHDFGRLVVRSRAGTEGSQTRALGHAGVHGSKVLVGDGGDPPLLSWWITKEDEWVATKLGEMLTGAR